MTSASEPSAPPADDAVARANGELQPWELLYRLGLLLAAGFFLVEGMGSPLDRNPLFLAAAFCLSSLVVVTLALQWRTLGDYRRPTRQVLLAALAVVLVVPIAAALNPRLGESALPKGLEGAIVGALDAVGSIPGLNIAVDLVRGVLVFLVTAFAMVVLVAHGGPARRGGIVFVGGAVGALALFFHPTAETVAGLAMLAFFFYVQWEPALLLPAHLVGRLSVVQQDFLRHLVREGGLSTGETKLLFANDAASFAQLVDYGLVEFDSVARQAVPGRRLLHDPAAAALDVALGWGRRALWVLAGVVYFLMPDLIPGPIDDLVIMAICAGAGFDWIGAIFGRKRP